MHMKAHLTAQSVCKTYTERDCDWEGMWSRGTVTDIYSVSVDRARILNQWSVYPKLPLILCLHSSFSLTNVWERQTSSTATFKCNNCEGISKVKRFIRWPLHHDHVKELIALVEQQRNVFQWFCTTTTFSLIEVLVWSRRHCHLPLDGKKLKERSDNVSTDICIYALFNL